MSQNSKQQLLYFRDLERLTKTGLVSYIFILTAGLITASAGAENISRFLSGAPLCESILTVVITINLLYILIRITDKISGLGSLHVQMDKIIFRFLPRSNRVILRELLVLLKPDERNLVDNLAHSEKTHIAHSIFSSLAEDRSIFERLLKNGIFRSWIWHWITLYGVIAFVLLGALSFSRSIFYPSVYAQAFFISTAVVAFAHIALLLFSGYRLISATKRIMREITGIYQEEIVGILRSFIKNEHLSRG